MEPVYKKIPPLKSLREWLVYQLLRLADWWLTAGIKPEKTSEKWLLVVKLDLLGDYVLYRNFLAAIKNQAEYKDHKLLFCCNQAVLELSQSLDDEVVDEWLPLKLKPFVSQWKYRRKIWQQLLSKRYERAIFPTQSRSFFYDDMLAKTITAQEIVAPAGNSYNRTAWQHRMAKNYYHLLPVDNHYEFEFELNRRFMDKCLHTNLDIQWPSIAISAERKAHRVLFAPGASAEFRRWSTDNFIALARHILQKQPQAEIIISGAPAENHLGEAIKAAFAHDKRVQNACGKQKLSELVYTLAATRLVVSNESGLVHLAQALAVPFIYCISNGNHYCRFNPYHRQHPAVSISYFYPPVFEQMVQNDQMATKMKYYWGSRLSIESVEVAALSAEFDAHAAQIFKAD